MNCVQLLVNTVLEYTVQSLQQIRVQQSQHSRMGTTDVLYEERPEVLDAI